MKIFITGDFCPINRADINLTNPIEILDQDFKNLLQVADLRVTNLECPLTTHSTPISKTGPALKADPKNILFLKENQFNLVTLANNHTMDYGSEGLKDTIFYLEENKIDYVGAGKSSEEIGVVYKTKDDLTVGIINVCENEWSTEDRDGYTANGFSEIKMFYAIREAKKNADSVVVIHHGGHEMYNLPSPRLKETLRFFVDCGADAVINHHTHCVGGDEVYKDAPILYSLGNFIFDFGAQRKSIWNYGMAVTLTCTKEKVFYEKHYFEQFSEEPKVRSVTVEQLPYNLADINLIVADDKELMEHFKRFVKEKEKMFNSFLEPVKSRYILALINKGLLPSIWHPRKKQFLKNLISCESHQEVLKMIFTTKGSTSN